jgi:hypothetical protein
VPMACRMLPSGCLIQDLNNGHCEVRTLPVRTSRICGHAHVDRSSHVVDQLHRFIIFVAGDMDCERGVRQHRGAGAVPSAAPLRPRPRRAPLAHIAAEALPIPRHSALKPNSLRRQNM